MVAIVESPMVLYFYLVVSGTLEIDPILFVGTFTLGVLLLGFVARSPMVSSSN